MPSHKKFELQRHLAVPFPVTLQVEFGHSSQSEDEEQTGSGGGAQPISISTRPRDETLEIKFPATVSHQRLEAFILNGNDVLNFRI